MSGKVFISCGQATSEERDVATEIHRWFRERGFSPYVAIQTQSIQDVNSGIINELRTSDYYVFIDFRRDQLYSEKGEIWRGSLFTNQELAIAYILGFNNVIFLQEKGIQLEGLLRYMGSNASIFEKKRDVPELVAQSVVSRDWVSTFTRHLKARELRWSDGLIRYGHLRGRFLYGEIENRRKDLGAANTIARLSNITYPQGNKIDSPNRSPLKVTGQPGYTQVIWPESYGAFDLLVVSLQNPCSVFLNNALDVTPPPALLNQVGLYNLEYEVFALEFPLLKFNVLLNLTNEIKTTTCELLSNVT